LVLPPLSQLLEVSEEGLEQPPLSRALGLEVLELPLLSQLRVSGHQQPPNLALGLVVLGQLLNLQLGLEGLAQLPLAVLVSEVLEQQLPQQGLVVVLVLQPPKLRLGLGDLELRHHSQVLVLQALEHRLLKQILGLEDLGLQLHNQALGLGLLGRQVNRVQVLVGLELQQHRQVQDLEGLVLTSPLVLELHLALQQALGLEVLEHNKQQQTPTQASQLQGQIQLRRSIMQCYIVTCTMMREILS